MKLYFSNYEDTCTTIKVHKEYMQENGIKEMEVFEAKAEHGTGYFWCSEFQAIGELGQGCGKFCINYQPRNGRTGICRHYRLPYEQTDKKKIIRI